MVVTKTAAPEPRDRNHETWYKVPCPWGSPCTGVLGELRRPRVHGLLLAHRNVSVPEARRGNWVLSHPNGYKRHLDGYRPIKTRELKRQRPGDHLQGRTSLGGNKPIPDHLRTPNVIHYDGWGIVGEPPPELPAVVYCPDCGRRCIVGLPPEG